MCPAVQCVMLFGRVRARWFEDWWLGMMWMRMEMHGGDRDEGWCWCWLWLWKWLGMW